MPSPLSWSERLAQFWGIGLLVGIVLLASVYLWCARESQTARPVEVVTLRPPLHAFNTGVEVIPVQHEIEFDLPACPTGEAGQLCLVIGTGHARPDPVTFT